MSYQGLLERGRGRHTTDTCSPSSTGHLLFGPKLHSNAGPLLSEPSFCFLKKSQTPGFFGLDHLVFPQLLTRDFKPLLGVAPLSVFLNSLPSPLPTFHPPALVNLTQFDFQRVSGYFPPLCVCICCAFCSDFPPPPTPSFPPG